MKYPIEEFTIEGVERDRRTMKRILRGIACGALTFGPMYLWERIANFYYLNSNPTFYTFSGLRVDVFVGFVLAGAVVSGAVMKDLRWAVICQTAALLVLFSLVYVFCDPRVCYSKGPDGLEPLRMGLFLWSVAVVGASLGFGAWNKPNLKKIIQMTIAFSAYVSLAYYPIVYTFAGTQILPPLQPWSAFVILALLSYSIAIISSTWLGRVAGIALPVASTLFLFLLSSGIATDYFSQILVPIEIILAGTLTGTALGAATIGLREGYSKRHRVAFSRLLLVVLLLVISTNFIGTNAVNGVVPKITPVATPTFYQGIPVYAGAYMDTPSGGSTGVRLTVDLKSNQSSIESNNFLSAGLGVHSPNCCVDGIDFSYRFDVYLFNNGNESLVASAWEICDNNAACGGHSWKDLMFIYSERLLNPNASAVLLQLEWMGHSVYWSYQVGHDPFANFTSFAAPRQENPGFNIGELGGGFHFFQFGIMSRYPIPHSGWSANFECPSVLKNGTWVCIDHAQTVQGADSYWKVLWKWGDSYSHVVATTIGENEFTMSFSPTSTMSSYQVLW